ncbi:hypothetical protein JJL56_01090 [Azospirillum sp. YIM DDC1]|uniref:Relaxase/mobilization nuclease domain-containing protein n=1 Tax=Azospirillum aestuarii TaxID=2802052 RepID=A0ABS1HRK1_9PROT|nr:hypothetical protein [Azospirillum aestuarii]MBK4717455.1 hypothetical protein [Azospirillum aestuarii]
MIIKTTQRGEAAWLSAHLTRTDANEAVTIIDGRGVVALDVHVALRQFEAQWRIANSRARDFLVHASISPAQPLSNDQWADAWGLYEEQHGLFGQPYIEVEHAKPGDSGRPSHRHRAYLRIRPDGRAVHLGHSFQANEVVARLCELRFGHPLTKGAHNRAVVAYLEQHGYSDDAGQLHGLTERRRPRAGRSEAEAQQESRSGSRKATAAECAAAAWQLADSPQARRAALAEAGFVLARGDRRNAVLAVDAAGEAWALHRLLAAGERGAWTAARVRKELEGVVDALPTVEELRGRLRKGPGPERVRSPSEETGGFAAHLVTSPAERKEPVAPAPVDDADSYWPTEPDNVSPRRPSLAPIVCRLGAGASVLTASSAAAPSVGEDVGEMVEDVPQAEPVRSAVTLPPVSPAGAAIMAPPSENRHESGHDASRTQATVRVAAPVPRQARPLAEDKAPRMAASASAGPPSSSAALQNRPAPVRDRRVSPAGRNGDHTGVRRRSLAPVPTQDHGSARPPASHSAQNQPIRPPAPDRSEWGDQRRPSVPPPPSVPSLDEGRRRKAEAAKTAARRIRDLTARGSRPPAPAGEAPSSVELVLADRLGSYVGALLDWWKARNDDTSRVEEAQERLRRAWQDLVATARLLLRRSGGSGTTEEACGALTQALTRSRPEARTAHERWLDRAYQPAAVPAPEADPAARASSHIRRVATNVVPRPSEPPERTPQGE